MGCINIHLYLQESIYSGIITIKGPLLRMLPPALLHHIIVMYYSGTNPLDQTTFISPYLATT